ncbi:MAG: response regulator, partial [Planctomycetota bacterium]
AREADFDDLTRLAARLADAPIALVSLVDEDRQWFKSRVGLESCQTPRAHAFCGYTILSDAPLIIEDAAIDPRTADNPLVTGEPGIRAYAGVPLRVSTGQTLGSLCVIDTKPRIFSDDQIDDLRALANQAARQLELRRQHAELRELDAKHASRLAARTASLAYMSHQVRTPLTSILGYAELIASDGTFNNNPNGMREAGSTIRRNASHLLSIVNDILDVSRIESGRLVLDATDVPIGETVAEVVHLLRPAAERQGSTLEARVLTPIPTSAVTDPTRFRQTLLNVAANAVKFTTNGRIGIDLAYDTATQSLTVGVTDTGIGMTSDELARVRDFAAFGPADDAMPGRFGGGGLGLRISKALAHLLGGDLTVDSLPKRGTIVTIRITAPMSAGARLVEDLAPPPAPDPVRTTRPKQALAGRRVLVAEDGEDNRKLIEHILRAAGADVVIAEDGGQALQTVSDTDKQFDAVVMDMEMPVLNGYDATHTLRAAGFDRPILALTANVMSGDRERSLQSGCDEYLAKPLDRNELVLAVARLTVRPKRDAA